MCETHQGPGAGALPLQRPNACLPIHLFVTLVRRAACDIAPETVRRGSGAVMGDGCKRRLEHVRHYRVAATPCRYAASGLQRPATTAGSDGRESRNARGEPA